MDRGVDGAQGAAVGDAPVAPGTAPPPAWSPPRDGLPRPPRQALAGVAQVLEQQVLPRLLQRHGARPAGDAPGALSPSVGARWLAALACSDDEDGVRRAVVRLREQGLPARAIALDWLAAAAQELGRQWEGDECGFADVTIGVGRLQRALRLLDDPGTVLPGLPGPGAPRVLLLLAPGEQHSFGLAIVAEAFRQEGWDVVGNGEITPEQAPSCVARERFDLVGISVGSQATAAGVPPLCGALRVASRHAGISILVGGPFVALGGALAAADLLGADAAAADVATAVALARQRLAPPPNPFHPPSLSRPAVSPPAAEASIRALARSVDMPATRRR